MEARAALLEREGVGDFRDPPFYFADEPARRVEPRWAELKDLGNVELAKGNYAGAIALYTDALLLATTRRPQFGVLSKLSFGNGKQLNAAVSNKILGFLPSPEDPYQFEHAGRRRQIQPLNKPAAICLANRAAAHLKVDNPQKALADGIEATRWCPEYLKGHHRVVRSHLALKQKAAAKKVKAEIKQFEAMFAMPDYSLAMLAVGWISQTTQQLQYQEGRYKEAVRRLEEASSSGQDMMLELSVGLVPFLVAFFCSSTGALHDFVSA